MSERPFVHLHVHSEYSLSDSIIRVKSLPASVRERGMPAVAITDLMNFYAAVKFYRACVDAGVKPLFGLDMHVADAGSAGVPDRLVVLCRNNEGYRFLSHLLTRAYMAPRQGVHVVAELDWFRGHDGNLVVLGGIDGVLGRAILSDNEGDAVAALDRYRDCFGERFCFEVSRVHAPREEFFIDSALAMAERHGVAALATNPAQFIEPGEFDAHDIRVCINEGRVLNDPRRVQRFTAQQYLKSPAEMAEAFAGQETLLDNTLMVAEQCNVFLDFSTSHMPAYPSRDDLDADQCLRRDAEEGLARRFAEMPAEVAESVSRPVYHDRLERELEVIIGMGFPGYFLIVADFIQWARENDIPVGPGRGSGAGSLVAWSLRITDLDPIDYGLLFERFLNPERVSLPDFDIDFCMDRRDEVIDYVARRYGADRVSQIITYGTMAARAVVRDVGRVMGHPYGFVDTLAKLVPPEIGITLDKALNDEPLFRQRYEGEEEVTELLDAAQLLEGLPRNVGKHAGGVVIAPDNISEFVPLYVEPGMSQPVTQYDKDDLEAIGLVKFDFLGLRTLTVIHNAVKLVNEHRAEPLVIEQLALDDKPTFELIKSGRTTGVFQLESRGMKEIITRLLPDRFEDLVALVALFRPGPLQSGMVDDFINRKHGRERIEYPHPSLSEILEPTYGVILYQEQVMQIAQVLSGYTLGAADLLRRAMGKKKPEEMAKQREVFVDGATANQVPPEVSGMIFDLVEKFAGYGFNKSHSAAYALLTYQTAWLKTHYPAEFMAASLTADMEHTDKVVTLIAETRAIGLDVHPPSVNHCGTAFRPQTGKAVFYGLGALKGVGEKAVDDIVAEREAAGAYVDLFDFCKRTVGNRLNKRVLEALVRGGALDCLEPCRATLMHNLGQAVELAEKQTRDTQSGQNDMFGVTGGGDDLQVLRRAEEWSEHDRLVAEKEVLGLYLTGHPFEPLRREVSTLVDADIDALKPSGDRDVVVAGLVTAVRTMKTRRGDLIAFVTLDDNTARIEVSVFSRLFARRRPLLRSDAVLVVRGTTEMDDYSGRVQMRANEVFELGEVRMRWLDHLHLELREDPADAELMAWLKASLAEGQGAALRIDYRRANGDRGELRVGERWRLAVDEDMRRELERRFGAERIHWHYDRAALLTWQDAEAADDPPVRRYG